MEEKKNLHSVRKGFFMGMLVTLLAGGIIFAIANRHYLFQGKMVPDEFGALQKISEIYGHVEDQYLEDVDAQELTDAMCAGLVDGLGDKYSAYYTKEEYAQMLKSSSGHYLGIGIAIRANEAGQMVIEECYDELPASNAGVKAGDILLNIQGESVRDMTAAEVAATISAMDEGTVLKLTLERDGKSYQTEVTLTEVESVSVTGEMLEEQIGYIRIREFTGVTSDQFAELYQRLQKEGMSALIIDLRNNPGGLLTAVCNTLRQILPEGVIVYTEDKDGERTEQRCKGETPIQIPLVVLVNENSASASEIFAGAVQDYAIGTIVGGTTYGKGLVQNTYPLHDGSAVKLTISHYFTPNGNDIHEKGITPDVPCDNPSDAGEDFQLEMGKEVLR